MLSLILYASCDCNYDLCKKQRNGDYYTWAVFDTFLCNAIRKLSKVEQLSNVNLYSGLSNVKLSKNILKQCYLPTFISTSWNKQVSINFIKHDGMLIKFANNIIDNVDCCSVDWISKHFDECEVLICRTYRLNDNKFDFKIFDETKKEKRIKERK